MRKDICYLSFWVFVLFSSYTQNLRTFHNLCWEWEIVCNLSSIFCSWNHLSAQSPLGPMFCGIHIVKKETRSKNFRDLEVYFLSFFFFFSPEKDYWPWERKWFFQGHTDGFGLWRMRTQNILGSAMHLRDPGSALPTISHFIWHWPLLCLWGKRLEAFQHKQWGQQRGGQALEELRMPGV